MITLGTKCYKNNFDSKLYTKMADFCNSSDGLYIVDEKDEYYEIIKYVKPQLSYKEQLEREKSELEAWLKEKDYIGVKIATGRATIEEYADVIAEMTVKANRINEIDKLLN